MENIAILILSVVYLAGFMARNLLVKRRTGQSIRSKSALVNLSIVLSAAMFTALFLSLYSEELYRLMGKISALRHPAVSAIGMLVFAASMVFGWVCAAQLRNSWRVGVLEEQKTELIQHGVYAYIRNPYFLSYFLMFFGCFLVRPSVVMLALLIAVIVSFHRMVLTEEAYLLKIHGEAYQRYMQNTGRYWLK